MPKIILKPKAKIIVIIEDFEALCNDDPKEEKVVFKTLKLTLPQLHELYNALEQSYDKLNYKNII